MLIAYYVIGIRNLSSVKIVTIVFIWAQKKLGPPLTFMDLVFTLGGFKLTIAYSKFSRGRIMQGLLLMWIYSKIPKSGICHKMPLFEQLNGPKQSLTSFYEHKMF